LWLRAFLRLLLLGLLGGLDVSRFLLEVLSFALGDFSILFLLCDLLLEFCLLLLVELLLHVGGLDTFRVNEVANGPERVNFLVVPGLIIDSLLLKLLSLVILHGLPSLLVGLCHVSHRDGLLAFLTDLPAVLDVEVHVCRRRSLGEDRFLREQR
jgi:hypothetical protein